MWEILEQIYNGLNTGILYGLVAIGYTMVYGIIKLINFAHGEVCMLGIMITFSLMSAFAGVDSAVIQTLLFTAFVLIAAVLDGTLGIGLDLVAYKPLRHASRLSALITAIGMSLLLQNLAVLIWDPSPKKLIYPNWVHDPIFVIGSIRVQYFALFIWVGTLLSMVCLYLLVMKTKLGTAMRACSQNSTAAALMGVRLDRVVGLTFFIGSLFAAFAGIAVAINKEGSFDYQIGLYIGLVAFAAAVLGGIGNIPGAMLGGVVIGVAEALAAGFLNKIPHPARLLSEEHSNLNVNGGYTQGIAFLVLILILIFRPQGLLGSKGGDRA
ncbi:MAG: branched-chain amino acid ABC transporter permease [Planctomycetota bacterium]|nr:branched-chain amino acid ABC transporter permease [Planctomycetota bacterium]